MITKPGGNPLAVIKVRFFFQSIMQESGNGLISDPPSYKTANKPPANERGKEHWFLPDILTMQIQ